MKYSTFFFKSKICSASGSSLAFILELFKHITASIHSRMTTLTHTHTHSLTHTCIYRRICALFGIHISYFCIFLANLLRHICSSLFFFSVLFSILYFKLFLLLHIFKISARVRVADPLTFAYLSVYQSAA